MQPPVSGRNKRTQRNTWQWKTSRGWTPSWKKSLKRSKMRTERCASCAKSTIQVICCVCVCACVRVIGVSRSRVYTRWCEYVCRCSGAYPCRYIYIYICFLQRLIYSLQPTWALPFHNDSFFNSKCCVWCCFHFDNRNDIILYNIYR